jgi:hypothetical protein
VATFEASGGREPTGAAPQRIATYVLLSQVAAVALIALYAYLTTPPQMGTSDEAFKTVDALYTAVRSRDEKRLQLCEQLLKQHREAGKLTPAAGDYLDGVIREARSGSWQAATERLYGFMLAQRR